MAVKDWAGLFVKAGVSASLAVRLANVLWTEALYETTGVSFHNPQQLLKWEDKQLLEIPGFGKKSLEAFVVFREWELARQRQTRSESRARQSRVRELERARVLKRKG